MIFMDKDEEQAMIHDKEMSYIDQYKLSFRWCAPHTDHDYIFVVHVYMEDVWQFSSI